MISIILTPFIVIVIYILVEVAKLAFFRGKLKPYKAFIPIFSAILGAIIAAVLYYTVPGAIEESTIVSAIGNGAFSGFAATGCNQVFKQLMKFRNELYPSEDEYGSLSDIGSTNKEDGENKDNNSNDDDPEHDA